MQITLKAARVNANLKQSDVAKKMRKGKQTIVNWENGKTTIDGANFKELCRIYGVDEDCIILPKT